jgi:hypothetical protein
MKTQILKNASAIIAIALLITTLFSACKKDKKSSNSSVNTAKEFTALFGPQQQRMQINANVANTFTLKGGTKITIPAGSFKKNGTTVTGNVTITAMEFLNRSSVVFGGTNTNHISGAPLESDGFIYLNAAVNGANVDQLLDKLIQVDIPTTKTNTTQIWEGVEKVGNANQMAWQAPAQNANGLIGRRETKAINGFYNFDMANLGWANCDVFFQSALPKTEIKVTLINNPGSFATFMGLTGETFVMFCAKGSNVAAQFYDSAGPNAVKSYPASIPVGVVGKFISFSIKNGKYYLAEQEVTTSVNQQITLTLSETTEAGIQQAINALNTY